MLRAFLRLLVLMAGTSGSVCYGIVRWNPEPGMNNGDRDYATLRANLRNAVVRVNGNPGSGSGAVIRLTPDTSGPGCWLCVLTADHVVDTASGWAIGFGNGTEFPYPAAERYRGPTSPNGRRVDLGVLRVRIDDRSVLPDLRPFDIGEPIRDGLLLAGYGNTGRVDDPEGAREYVVADEFGTYRNGHAAEIATVTSPVYTGGDTTYQFVALQNTLQFMPGSGEIRFGEGHILPGDSGGPSLQWTVDGQFDWWPLLVGIHAASERSPIGPWVSEGARGWDVRVANYLDWINPACDGSIAPPSYVPGDYNSDGRVDAADYVWWRKNNGMMSYDTWRTNFGTMSGGGSSANTNAAVPEPATLAQLMFAAAASCLSRCWSHRKDR